MRVQYVSGSSPPWDLRLPSNGALSALLVPCTPAYLSPRTLPSLIDRVTSSLSCCARLVICFVGPVPVSAVQSLTSLQLALLSHPAHPPPTCLLV